MHTLDNFGKESGAPKGSRLAMYIGTSAARADGLGSSTSILNANVPDFVPQFNKMALGDQHVSTLPSPSQGSLGFNRPYVNGMAQGTSSTPQQQKQAYQQFQGGTTYFFQNDTSASSSVMSNSEQMDMPDPHHSIVNTNGCFTYQGPLPHIGKFRPKGAAGNGAAQFVTPELRMELVNRQLAMECRADPNVYTDLPQQVEHLNNLVPLENIAPHSRNSVYRAHSIRDGVPYCIRRLHEFRVASPKQLQPLENWKKLSNAHVVQLREVIPHTRAFGDSSLILVYDYYPLADSLKTRHFGRMQGSAFVDGITGAKLSSPHCTPSLGAGVHETQLWSYVIQLSAALRAIHSSGLAAKCVELSKILVHGRGKIILSGCGQQDLMNPDNQPIAAHQNNDMYQFGRVLLALATGNAFAGRNDLLQQNMQYLSTHYSADMKNLILYLLSPPTNNKVKSVAEIMPMIGARFYVQLESTQTRADTLENELSKELENGRLFRLLCKLNTILERPEHNMDPSWAETGDRFLLKLFRDYIFHQIMENGKPWLDMAHIVQCLNKLDAGVPEKIELVSRDGENQIIVSYGDLKRCIESAFRDLTAPNAVVARH